MARYGLDLGTTTTVLTDYSTGKSVEIAIGAGKEIAIASDVSGLRSAKRFLSSDTSGSIECMPAPGIAEVSAAVKKLFELVVSAAKAKGHDISVKDSVRLGCPAAWDGDARQKLVDLALEAKIGLDSFTLVEESVAAGIYWSTQQKFKDGVTKALVFDMGGGTLDLSVLEFESLNGDLIRSEVLASEGSKRAGDYFDCEFAKYLSKEIGGISAADLLGKQSVTKVKEDLTFNSTAALTPINGGQKLSFRNLTGQDLEQVAKSSGFLNEITVTIDKLLRRSYLHSVAVKVGATAVSLRHAQTPAPTIVDAIADLKVVLRGDGSDFADVLEKYPYGVYGHTPSNSTDVVDALKWRSLSLIIEGIKHLSSSTLLKQIDHVIFVGGMSLMPLVQKHVASLFPKAAFYIGAKEVKASEIGSVKVQVKDASELVGSVAKGLNDEKALKALNLDRMKYDIILEVPGGSPILIQKAFDKVYDEVEIRDNHPHLHRVFALPKGLPSHGTGLIRFRSPNGQNLPVTTEEKIELTYKYGPFNVKENVSYEPRIVINLTGDVDIYDGYGNHKRVSQYFRSLAPVAFDVKGAYAGSEEAQER
jgi:actin-like ATPase involved in cell morphogenesis